MKKLLLISLATAVMMAGCSNDETMEKARPEAIGFSNVFVDNATRSAVDPSLTKATLSAFKVYGFSDGAKIFDGTTVSSSDNGLTWTYAPPQYWISDHTYTFGAIAPENISVSGVDVMDGKVNMTVHFVNDGMTDLLHAAPPPIAVDATFVENPQMVAMTFSHQLSKVKFSFVNEVSDAYRVKVTDIKITDAKKEGTLTVGGKNEWNSSGGTFELEFGNAVTDDAEAADAAEIAFEGEAESYREMLMIPTGHGVGYTVTFKTELLTGDATFGPYSHTVNIQGVQLHAGYCYDFKATLTKDNVVDPETPLKPITFTVDEISGWDRTAVDQTLGTFSD